MADLPTPEDFIQRAVSVGLADRGEIDRALSDLGSDDRTLPDVIECLQRRGVLTTLQCEKLIRGDKGGYYYGDYKIQYLIGSGTFARVYRAEKNKEVFAVKVLRKRFRDEPKEMEQFLREGRMGLKLKHPNIVRILDVVPDVRNPFLVMEFVEGQTLRELVKIRGNLPIELSLKLAMEIAAGLAYAAGLGISHRDLKLSNVLISSSGTAKLVDFGLAALADRNNPEQIADCPNARAIDYATLEKSTNVRKDDPRSDIYFTGNMLYHMMAGMPALSETRDRLARLNVSRFHEIVPIVQYVPEIPGIVTQLLSRILSFDPDKRIQTAAGLRIEIEKVIEALKRGPTERRDAESGATVDAADVGDDQVVTNEGEGYVVMLVESKANLQNAVRERLKARGYRVLIIADPKRALDRFVDAMEPPADCVIFGAAELGTTALDAYNQFTADEHTAEIPAVLLVDQRQQHIINRARRGPNRALLPLPLRVKQLRVALMQLLANVEKRTPGMM